MIALLYEHSGHTKVFNRCQSFKTLPIKDVEVIGTISNFGNSLKCVYDASYLQFYQLLIDVKVSGRKYTEMTSSELQTVENIAQANNYGSVYAESLLAMLNQTAIDRIPHKEDSQSNKKANSNDLASFIQIYPNPNEGQVTVESLVEEARLLVYNITGQLIQQEILELGKNQLKINAPNGTYFFKIESEEQSVSHKVIISQ
ncbi:MAG: T9SS type A sorting domain-containing protein [Chitinophagales bacterium]